MISTGTSTLLSADELSEDRLLFNEYFIEN